MPAVSINVSNVQASSGASTFQGLAGDTIGAGQPCYLNTVTNTWVRANCFLTNLAGAVAQANAVNGQYLVLVRSDPNFATGFSINAGDIYTVGNTAGAVQPFSDRATGWYVQSLYVGIGQNRANFSLTGANAASA